MSTSPARGYHHGDLRTALLRRAEEVVRSAGAGALSLRELARDLGVSHAAPRRHFPDRAALLDALAEAGFERLGAALADARPAAGAPFRERLAALARAYVAFAARDAELLPLMFAAKHARDASTGLRAAAERALDVPLRLVTDGQADGSVAPGDPRLAGIALLSAVHGFASLTTSGVADEEAERALDATVAVLARGLAPTPDPAPGLAPA